MTDSQRYCRLQALWILKRIKGLGPKKIKSILEAVEDPGCLLERSAAEALAGRCVIDAETVREFHRFKDGGEFEREFEACEARGIQMVGIGSPEYPQNLAGIYDAPVILYVKGRLIAEDEAAIGVVGTRHPSIYGIRTSRKISAELAESGLTIVSGLARGIDAEAHRGALEVKGRTVAVLGCGVDKVYPGEHRELYEKISGQGAVISEYPPGTEPLRFNFPQRNRIISGLSLGG